MTIPGGDYILHAGDHIYVTAQAVNLAQLIKNLGIGSHKVRQAILIGGGRVSYYLAERLLAIGVGVKIIEKDELRARYLAEQLPQATVICGDGSDNALLESEDIESADALVTLTGMDEENIVVSMYACSRGVRKVVTKVNRLDYGNMFINMGVGSVVSPKELCSASHRTLCPCNGRADRQCFGALSYCGRRCGSPGIPCGGFNALVRTPA